MELINKTGVDLQVLDNGFKVLVDYDLFSEIIESELKPQIKPEFPKKKKSLNVTKTLNGLGLTLNEKEKVILKEHFKENAANLDTFKTKYLLVEDCYNRLLEVLTIQILNDTYVRLNGKSSHKLANAVIDVFLENSNTVNFDTKLLISSKGLLNSKTECVEILNVQSFVEQNRPYMMQDAINERRLKAAKQETQNKDSVLNNWEALGFSCKHHCETFFHTNRYLDLSYEGIEVGSLVVMPSMYE